MEKIIMVVKDEMIDQKFYFKKQPLQHYEIACIGWLHQYTNKVDCSSLEEYLIVRVTKLLKRPAQLACLTKEVFAGQVPTNEEKSLTIKSQTNKSPKAVYIDILKRML